MHIQSIPMCNLPLKELSTASYCQWLTLNLGTGTSDNYAYLVIDDKSKDAVIIDPANPDELVQSNTNTRWGELIRIHRVAPVLKDQISSGKINLTAIVNTHQYVHFSRATEEFWRG
jgi:glyoxylase-like metal-dependent hydrolase (beta-lactamase superfamily II)